MTCPVCKKFSSAFQWASLAMGLHACPHCGAVNYPRAITLSGARTSEPKKPSRLQVSGDEEALGADPS